MEKREYTHVQKLLPEISVPFNISLLYFHVTFNNKETAYHADAMIIIGGVIRRSGDSIVTS